MLIDTLILIHHHVIFLKLQQYCFVLLTYSSDGKPERHFHWHSFFGEEKIQENYGAFCNTLFIDK